MQLPVSKRIRSSFASAPGTVPDAAVAADFVVVQWKRIECFLRTMVGQRGASALYRRCLHLASAKHPWLQELEDGSTGTLDLEALRIALASRALDEAADAGDLLLETLCDLLTHFIGQPAADRLLLEV